MKNSPVPFRILGHHNGKLIILRTYPDHVTISIGWETHRFPSYDTCMQYLRQLTKSKQVRGYQHGK